MYFIHNTKISNLMHPGECLTLFAHSLMAHKKWSYAKWCKSELFLARRTVIKVKLLFLSSFPLIFQVYVRNNISTIPSPLLRKFYFPFPDLYCIPSQICIAFFFYSTQIQILFLFMSVNLRTYFSLSGWKRSGLKESGSSKYWWLSTYACTL